MEALRPLADEERTYTCVARFDTSDVAQGDTEQAPRRLGVADLCPHRADPVFEVYDDRAESAPPAGVDDLVYHSGSRYSLVSMYALPSIMRTYRDRHGFEHLHAVFFGTCTAQLSMSPELGMWRIRAQLHITKFAMPHVLVFTPHYERAGDKASASAAFEDAGVPLPDAGVIVPVGLHYIGEELPAPCAADVLDPTHTVAVRRRSVSDAVVQLYPHRAQRPGPVRL